MYTRKAHNSDEAWMLEKLSQKGIDEASFYPRDFLIGETEDNKTRVAFGRIKYNRNKTDNKEYVEIDNVIILDKAEDKHGYELLVSLVEKAKELDFEQVFTLPYSNFKFYKTVGFKNINKDEIPNVIQNNLEDKKEQHGDNVQPMVIRTNQITYSPEKESDKNEKPQGDSVTNKKEIEDIKNEMNINENTTYKYST